MINSYPELEQKSILLVWNLNHVANKHSLFTET